ncbi:hypothetical protein [Nitrococcus mobilis]|uniref:Uncharacterized protein n=1 Tax=Nitrococcus mobilis Nb-231 TaxID=314278 RepID=A4BTX8_9GAMM|nr:hypothetical protein [Nitrococcus mobilis]EAR20799.1 hypothetical protein NB231_10999 [Nitrococcus mobilis Nb-231]
MYDLLLKWGLESLSKATLNRSEQELSVMLEAIRAKNTLVAERFRFAWNTSQSIIGVALEVEEVQEELKNAIQDYQWKTKTGRSKILWQLQEFHARYARKLKKVRCSYDATNDLLSAYSSVFDSLLHLDLLSEFADARGLTKRSDVLWLYRGLWQFYARVMSSLVRVTSSDLRFWLTDEPYIAAAFIWATKDLDAAKAWLSRPVGHGQRFFLSLETPGGLVDFWSFVENRE